MRFSNDVSNNGQKYRWFTDETVVTVKPEAYEDMVTYLRINLRKVRRMSEEKGGNTQTEWRYPLARDSLYKR